MNSLGHYEDAGIERAKSHTLLSLAELHMARGSDYEAEQPCRDAIDLAERTGEIRNLALAHQYLGHIAARRNEAERADAEFELAIGILEANDATQRLIDCRMAYADVLEQRGDLAGANRQLRTALGRIGAEPALSRTASA
jgi:tetratricopeptide (TPR) repeat protein